MNRTIKMENSAAAGIAQDINQEICVKKEPEVEELYGCVKHKPRDVPDSQIDSCPSSPEVEVHFFNDKLATNQTKAVGWSQQAATADLADPSELLKFYKIPSQGADRNCDGKQSHQVDHSAVGEDVSLTPEYMKRHKVSEDCVEDQENGSNEILSKCSGFNSSSTVGTNNDSELLQAGMNPDGQKSVVKTKKKKKKYSQVGIFKCELCDKTFNFRSTLYNHKKTHSNARPHECEICRKTYKHHFQLLRHIKTHSDERPFKCDICDKAYRSKGDLSVHQKVHLEEHLFKCEICDKTYTYSSQLRVHRYTHSEKPSFRCETCGKSFKRQDSLSNHKRVHSTARPFKCDTCGKTYKQNYQLQNHIKTHSEERPYKCDVCDRTYKNKNNLCSYKKLHSDERPFECGMCGKTYKFNYLLLNHIQIHLGSQTIGEENETDT